MHNLPKRILLPKKMEKSSARTTLKFHFKKVIFLDLELNNTLMFNVDKHNSEFFTGLQ